MLSALTTILAQINPTPTQPPGTEGLGTLINWLAWGATFAAVAGLLITAALMALSHRRGEGSEHMSRLGMVLGACVIIAAAGGLVGALV